MRKIRTFAMICLGFLMIIMNTGCEKSSSRKEMLTDRQKWALAAAAIPKRANDMELDVVGGGGSDVGYVEMVRDMLKNDWDVTDSEGARNVIKWLKEEGDRAEFDAMLDHVMKLDENSFATLLAGYSHEPELQKKLRLVYAKKGEVGNKSILAWDYCRFIYLTECCSRAGYLTDNEAWQEIIPAAKVIQSTFSSWREMGDNYLLGRQFWSGGNEPRIFVANRFLLSDPKSPWVTLPWELQLN